MKTVRVSNKKPPQWILDAVKEQFNVEWESSVIFTYGDLITTSTGVMSEDLMHHEPIHTKQQEKFGGADKWWREYLSNPQFRFEQELECYINQYKWVKNNIKNRQESFALLMHYAESLSGDMYGSVISKTEALQKIQSGV